MVRSFERGRLHVLHDIAHARFQVLIRRRLPFGVYLPINIAYSSYPDCWASLGDMYSMAGHLILYLRHQTTLCVRLICLNLQV